MFTVSRKDLGELLALFRLVESMCLPLNVKQNEDFLEKVHFSSVMREEGKVKRKYYLQNDKVCIDSTENNHKEIILLPKQEWSDVANHLFEALRQTDDENLVLIDDDVEQFLDKAQIYSIAGTNEGQHHLFLETAMGPLQAGVFLRVGAYPTKILDGGRSANIKLEQTGTRFASPMAAKVNAFYSDKTVRDRMFMIEDMGSSLKYSNVADKVFRANLAMIDLHLGRLLAEMIRVSYIEDILKVNELTQRMNEINPLKVKSELIEKHHYYEFKIKQLLLACISGMRPAKIYKGQDTLPFYTIFVNPNGQLFAYSVSNTSDLADFLYHNTRLERGDLEKDKYGELERENNVYYFKLNLKIGLTKR